MKRGWKLFVGCCLIAGLLFFQWGRTAVSAWEDDDTFRYYVWAYIADYIHELATEEPEADQFALWEKWINQIKLVSAQREGSGDLMLSSEDLIGSQHEETTSFVYDVGTVMGADDSETYEAWMITVDKFRSHGKYSLGVELSENAELTFCSARYRTLTGDGFDDYITPVADEYVQIPARKGAAFLKNIVFFQAEGAGSADRERDAIRIEYSNQGTVFTVEKK